MNLLIFLSQSVLTLFFIKYFNFINSKGSHEFFIGGWNKNIGISLKNTPLSMSFIMLSIIIWWSVILYSWNYKKDDSKFWFFLLFLEGVFLALLQTNDLFNFFILLEVTTILSTILIIYKKDGHSVRSGLYYLLFNSCGMLFFLIGLIIIYMTCGSLNFDIIASTIPTIKDSLIIKISFVFMLCSFGVKSAFFPVYTWLPKAHGAAPASISALLSGLLVKSGLYGVIKLNNIYNYSTLSELLFFLGFITGICGIIFALSQKDIKQILAFHTISQIGIILIGISSFNQVQYYGGILHIFNHAIFKSLLFLGVGIIINHYETRKITEIRGVFKFSPVLSICLIIGVLSITGSPFFNGFVSKSIIKYSLKGSTLKVFLIHILNLGTITSFIKFSQIFFGSSSIKRNEFNLNTLSLIILSLLCILLGTCYTPIFHWLFKINLSFVSPLKLYNFIYYISLFLIGYVLYKTLISKDYVIIKKIRHSSISFDTANILLLFFVFFMTAYFLI